MGFTSTTSEPCVYNFGTSDTFNTLTLYVDDPVLLRGSTSVMKKLKRKLMERFTMNDIRHVSLVLGMQITRDREAGTLNDQSRKLHQVHSGAIRHGGMQPGAHDGCRRRAFSRSARRYPTRSHVSRALLIHHWVSDVAGPMHALRHHLCRQPIGPSHEQVVQVPYDSSEAPSPIPGGKYISGTYVPNRLLLLTDRLLRCELGKSTLTMENQPPGTCS